MITATRATGPLLLVAAIVGGILAGERFGPGPARVELICAVVAGAAAVVVAARAAVESEAGSGSVRFALVLAVVAAAPLGDAVMRRALDGLVHSPLSTPIATRADATISGSLVDDPDGQRFSASALVRVADLTIGRHHVDGGGRTMLVRASGDAAPRLDVLEAGDRVTVRGWLRPLDEFESRYRWRHAVGAFEAVAVTAFAQPVSTLVRVANAARDAVLRGTLGIAPAERAIVAGFLVGDTRNAPPLVVEQFRASGLSHLLVVSGENVAFVLALAGPMLRRLPRRARLVAAVGVLLLFGTMTRWEPSVLRACAMAGCSLLAVFLGRPVAGLRALALAVGALVVADPFLVHSVGFLLSCGACVGIAVAGPWVTARLRGPVWFRESLGATVGAQLGVAPVLIPVFGSVPLVSLPANLLAVPLAGPLTVWGLAAGVVGGAVRPFAPPVAAALQLPTVVLVRAVMTIAAVAARAPVAVGAAEAGVLVAVGVAVGLGTAVRRRGRMLGRRDLVVPPG